MGAVGVNCSGPAGPMPYMPLALTIGDVNDKQALVAGDVESPVRQRKLQASKRQARARVCKCSNYIGIYFVQGHGSILTRERDVDQTTMISSCTRVGATYAGCSVRTQCVVQHLAQDALQSACMQPNPPDDCASS